MSDLDLETQEVAPIVVVCTIWLEEGKYYVDGSGRIHCVMGAAKMTYVELKDGEPRPDWVWTDVGNWFDRATGRFVDCCGKRSRGLACPGNDTRTWHKAEDHVGRYHIVHPEGSIWNLHKEISGALLEKAYEELARGLKPSI